MRTPRTAPFLVCAALAALAAGGCVERKLLLRTDPEGAAIRLNGEELAAVTPVELPAPFDGPNRVQFSAPGHAPREVVAEVPTRWYDRFPLDLVAEFLWPGTIRETVTVDTRLEPYVPLSERLSEEQLNSLRSRMDALGPRSDEARAAAFAGGDATPSGAAASAPVAPEGTVPDAPADGVRPPRPSRPPQMSRDQTLPPPPPPPPPPRKGSGSGK
jgi:hypothetical protein